MPNINKIDIGTAYLMLLDFKVTSTITLYFVNNSENVTFFRYGTNTQQVYTAFPFEFEEVKETNKGELPSISLRVAGISQELNTMLDLYGGCVGSTIIARVVRSDSLNVNSSELTWIFDILGTSIEPLWITFTLGPPMLLRQRFPRMRYIADFCNFTWGDIFCNPPLSTTYTTCNRTYSDCIDRFNMSHFGGFLGLRNDAVKIIR